MRAPGIESIPKRLAEPEPEQLTGLDLNEIHMDNFMLVRKQDVMSYI
jgi:hypothetical protein